MASGKSESQLESGFQAYADSEFVKAAEIADEVLTDNPQDPEALYLSGLVLRALGSLEKALLFLREAQKFAPGDARYRIDEGRTLIDLRRFKEATELFTGLLAAGDDSGEISFRLAEAHRKNGDVDTAEKYLAEAKQAMPDNAGILLEEAHIWRLRREFRKAADCAEQVLAQDPENVSARIFTARAALVDNNPDEVLQILVRADKSDPVKAVTIWNIIGDALDRKGDFRTAWEAYEQSNTQARNNYQGRYGGQSGETASLVRVRRAAETYRKLPVSEKSEAYRSDHQHAFLVGFARSGTTLLEQILGAHPQVKTSDEQNHLWPIIQYANRDLDAFLRRPAQDLQEFRDAYWQSVASQCDLDGETFFLDKLPLNSAWLGIIARLFPQAPVIFALRDPRDCIISAFRRAFTMNAAMYNFTDLDDAAAYYDAVMSAAKAAREVWPGQAVLYSKYEDLVSDHVSSARQMADHLGLEWSAEIEEYRERMKSRTISTPSAMQVVQPINSDAVQKWSDYEFALQPVLPVLQPWIDHWGY